MQSQWQEAVLLSNYSQNHFFENLTSTYGHVLLVLRFELLSSERIWPCAFPSTKSVLSPWSEGPLPPTSPQFGGRRGSMLLVLVSQEDPGLLISFIKRPPASESTGQKDESATFTLREFYGALPLHPLPERVIKTATSILHQRHSVGVSVKMALCGQDVKCLGHLMTLFIPGKWWHYQSGSLYLFLLQSLYNSFLGFSQWLCLLYQKDLISVIHSGGRGCDPSTTASGQPRLFYQFSLCAFGQSASDCLSTNCLYSKDHWTSQYPPQGKNCCQVVMWASRKDLAGELEQFTHLLSGWTKTPAKDEARPLQPQGWWDMLTALKQSSAGLLVSEARNYQRNVRKCNNRKWSNRKKYGQDSSDMCMALCSELWNSCKCYWTRNMNTCSFSYDRCLKWNSITFVF